MIHLFMALVLTGSFLDDMIPETRSESGCAVLVSGMAQDVARGRWFMDISEKEFLDTPYIPGVPQWKQDLGQKMIKDAYAWKGDGHGWVNHVFEECKKMILKPGEKEV